MTDRTKIDFNLDGLNEVLDKMGADLATRVGVLGGNSEREEGELTNAEIGAVHEFGNEVNPPRSFLRFPLQLKGKEIIKALSSKSAREAFESGDYEEVYKILGISAEVVVQEAFETGGFGQWPALKPETVAKKGSAAKLIETGELRKAITSDVVQKSELR